MDPILLMKATLMGIVEGLTEFLPISSTGHLILAGSLLNFTGEAAKVFDIAIQSGAIFAVILVYWQRVRDTLSGLGSDGPARRFDAVQPVCSACITASRPERTRCRIRRCERPKIRS